MDETIHNQLKEIKQSFRSVMSGPTSSSMREKGVNYKINWGVPLHALNEMAVKYGKNYELAIELWKEPIRECKILATRIMPPERMLPEIADLWMEQTSTQELAELLATNLFHYLEFAPILAYEWIASNKRLYAICAYNLLSRLFSQGKEPNERGINEFLDQSLSDLEGTDLGVKHAAYNCLMRFCDMGEEYEQIAQHVFKAIE